jgi:hypothetical protein
MVRLAAARGLEVRDKQTVAVLTDLARRAAPGDRGEVLRLLNEKDRPRTLLDELEADLRADELDARLASAVALVQLDADRAAIVLPLLAGILEGWAEDARIRAALALKALATAARPTLPALRRRTLRDDSEAVRHAARAAIRAINAKNAGRD